MTAERWDRVKSLYDASRAQPQAERAAFLTRATAGDDELRRDVQRLLDQPIATTDFVQFVGGPRGDSTVEQSLAGRRFGSFEIQTLLGRGGMGEVYRAHDTRLGRDVAFKVLPAAFTADAGRLASFEREARVVASLNHPHIAAIHGVEESDGVRGLVLELVEGETLAEKLASSAGSGRPGLRLQETLGYARQIADALEAAHEKGITHRDLKPANIKITPDGSVKLLDFGIAKVVTGDGPGLDLTHANTATADATHAGLIVGTAGYMSPEQARGKSVDKRTDIWAFGCVLYEMLSGRMAFAGDTVSDTVAVILDRDPDWAMLPADTPRTVRRLLQRCLDKDPKQRLRDIGDARVELEQIISGPSEDLDARVAAQQARTWRRRKLAAAFGAGAVVAALGAGAVGQFRQNPVADSMWLSILPPPDGFDLAPDPAVSPDGRHIAYKAQDRSHRTHIWLTRLDAPGAAPIPGTEGTDFTSAHFWSPDSRSLGFFAQGKLKRVDIDGGAPQVLAAAPEPRGGTWSRNGTIIFNADARNLMRVAASGGTVSSVAGASDGMRIFPHALPDGRHYLFWSSNIQGQGRGIYVGSLDSPETRRIAAEDSTVAYARGYLFFARQHALFAQSFDVDGHALSGDPRQVADGIGVGVGNPFTYAFSVSDAGIVTNWSGSALPNLQLTWFDRAGRRLAAAGRHPVQAGFTLDRAARRAALELPNTAARGIDVWLLDLASGAAASRLTSDGRFSVPVVSPDGSRVAMMERDRGIVIQAQGRSTAPELIVPGSSSKWPLAWSSDGRFLAFADLTPSGSRLWTTLARAGSEPTLYREAPFALSGLEFSPDGAGVAYVSHESGQPDVYVDAYPTPDNRIRVSTEGGSGPKWRRDGRELYYLAPDRKLMVSSVQTTPAGMTFSTPQALFEGPGVHPDTLRTQFEPSPDGSRFLFNARVDDPTPRGLTVITNWPALLK